MFTKQISSIAGLLRSAGMPDPLVSPLERLRSSLARPHTRWHCDGPFGVPVKIHNAPPQRWIANCASRIPSPIGKRLYLTKCSNSSITSLVGRLVAMRQCRPVRGSHNGCFGIPSKQIESRTQCWPIYRASRIAQPIKNRFCFAKSTNQMARRSVSVLVASWYPAAIFRTVIAIIVLAFNGQRIGIAIAERPQFEGGKLGPFSANYNSSTTVPMIICRVFREASFFDAAPNLEEPCVGISGTARIELSHGVSFPQQRQLWLEPRGGCTSRRLASFYGPIPFLQYAGTA